MRRRGRRILAIAAVLAIGISASGCRGEVIGVSYPRTDEVRFHGAGSCDRSCFMYWKVYDSSSHRFYKTQTHSIPKIAYTKFQTPVLLPGGRTYGLQLCGNEHRPDGGTVEHVCVGRDGTVGSWYKFTPPVAVRNRALEVPTDVDGAPLEDITAQE